MRPEAENTIIRIFHFNDVYEVLSRDTEPVGGAARFKTAIMSLLTDNSLVLFSGDCVAPSRLSGIFKGKQMIPVLNQCRVECAVLGNHDFDFGVENLESIMAETNFPWLMSNVVDIEESKPLAGASVYHIIEKAGKKIGLIGLVEEEWLATLSLLDKDDVIYTDYVIMGKKLAQFLREEKKVDYVIALTHMRFPNDCRLAENVGEIDLILGGHDHVFDVRCVNGIKIIKSGSDFRELSKIDILFKEDNSVELSIDKVEIVSTFEEDIILKKEIDEFTSVMEGQMDTVLCHFLCDLDGRFSSIRTQETNLGNLFSDIMLTSTGSDIAILNSGTLRKDEIHPKGDFTLGDLYLIMPNMDPSIVLAANGHTIWQALENGVSQYPKWEGRFPQVSGVRFAFDPRKPSGKRVDPKFIKIGDKYLEMDKEYRLVTKAYLYQGKDGYECLKDCKVLVSEEESPSICDTIQNYFTIMAISGQTKPKKPRHIQKYISSSKKLHLSRLHETSLTHEIVDGLPNQSNNNNSLNDFNSHGDSDVRICRLEPKIENRIVIITSDEIRQQLEEERNRDLGNALIQ